MDFFEQQSRAQKKTKWLVFYFLLAVVGIIAALQLVFTLVQGQSPLNLETLGLVSGGVLVVVTIGSVIKTIELSQGGRIVAAMLGGQPVGQNAMDLHERKLINVVEEMAIASGVPVPEIYVLPDQTINAFAAGHGPGDTAIGVTRGCIERLSRDELQGVIAHEFSHILHGDMKLNIQLMGLLNGILGLAFLGRIILEWAPYSSMSSSRDDRDKGNGAAFFLIAGLALLVIGFIGVFFGKLIKAAVSRQREFLADASAVQYTRNPSGIAGALWKIGKVDSRLSSPRADEASHMFFGNGLGESWMQWFATHPPIDERIRAIEPNFDPESLESQTPPPPLPEEKPKIAAFDKMALFQAGAMIASLPDFAGAAAHDLHGACALVYALLLDDNDTERSAQLAALQVDDALRQETLGIFARKSEINGQQKIVLADLAIPTLRHLSPAQFVEFRENVRRLVESDQQIQLFEYALQKSIVRHLDLYFSRATGAPVKYRSVVPLLPDISTILSALAYVGQADPAVRDTAYAAGVRELMVKPDAYPFQREDTCDLGKVDVALDHLAQAAPEVKRKVLAAGRQTVMHDGQVPEQEYELLRAIADSLDCPMPPLSA